MYRLSSQWLTTLVTVSLMVVIFLLLIMSASKVLSQELPPTFNTKIQADIRIALVSPVGQVLGIPPRICSLIIVIPANTVAQLPEHYISFCEYARTLMVAAASREYTVSSMEYLRLPDRERPLIGFRVSSPTGSIACYWEFYLDGNAEYYLAWSTFEKTNPMGLVVGNDWDKRKTCLGSTGYYVGRNIMRSIGEY